MVKCCIVIFKNSKNTDGCISNVPRAHDSATSLFTKPNTHSLKAAKYNCPLPAFHLPTGERGSWRPSECWHASGMTLEYHELSGLKKKEEEEKEEETETKKKERENCDI